MTVQIDPAATRGLQRPSSSWTPLRDAQATLVDQLTDHLVTRIQNHGLRPGTRLPSVRVMAETASVSRFTVVQAYDRLVALGLVQSRRGAGFYVSAQNVPHAAPVSADLTLSGAFDTPFLLRSMFRDDMRPNMPGGVGLLPAEWLDEELVAGAIRAVGRSTGRSLLGYGVPQGFRALRQQIASTLQSQDVPAHPDHHLMTVAGVTQGLDLIVRTLVRPGETVLVEDPAWFLIFGRLASAGIKVVGVPRLADGPDVQALAALAQAHSPRLFIVNSVVHNPTGHTLSPGVAYDVLRIAERHDFLLVEDDTYADFHSGSPVRLAALDRLDRVLLVGGYSKTLAASLRVGYIAARPQLIAQLSDTKLLCGLTNPELGEQVLHRILADGQYRRHVDRLRNRVDSARASLLRALQLLNLSVETAPAAGMFVWADCGSDSETLARRAAQVGLLLAPGVLFSPTQTPSSKLRISVAAPENRQGWQKFTALLASQACELRAD